MISTKPVLGRVLIVLYGLLGLAAVASTARGCELQAAGPPQASQAEGSAGGASDATEAEEEKYVRKTKAELRRILTPMQFRVTQEDATEPAFRNEYWDNKREGVYHCVVCNLPLFDSQTKFESGTGWPSFWQPLSEENVGTKRDRKLFYTRIEVHCARCRAHLGHVFDDGPLPTGKRYCMNSAAMRFEERREEPSP